MKPVRFLEAAQEEFLEQVAYYEEREKGLGERFRQAVEAATALASAHPKLGSPWKLRTRRVFLKGFKFAVVYRVAPAALRASRLVPRRCHRSPFHTAAAIARVQGLC